MGIKTPNCALGNSGSASGGCPTPKPTLDPQQLLPWEICTNWCLPAGGTQRIKPISIPPQAHGAASKRRTEIRNSQLPTAGKAFVRVLFHPKTRLSFVSVKQKKAN